MKEKDFQRGFGRWAKSNLSGSSAFELKLARGPSLPFADVQPHQIEGLLNAKHGKFHMKLPDCGFQNPFDSILIDALGKAFVVIRYGSGAFYGVDVDAFVAEHAASTRKSLTEVRAKELCCFSG